MLSAIHYRISRTRLLSLLEEIKANSAEIASLYIPPDSSQTTMERMLLNLADVSPVLLDLKKSIAGSPTGAVVFWGPEHRYLVMPPFPINEEISSSSCDIEPLYTLLHREYLLGLVIVRLGAYGIGVYKGETMLSSKAGTGLVHARHRQGGSSAHRFERHRDKQIEMFFTRVCSHIREQFEPYARQMDYIIYGGTKETVLDFRKQCRFLQEFNKQTLDLLLNIREPKKSGLEEGIREAWSSRIIRWDNRQPSSGQLHSIE